LTGSIISLFADEIRPEAAEMVHQMQQKNFQVVMLTGDHKEVAEDVRPSSCGLSSSYIFCLFFQICQTVSIPLHDCHSRLMPQEKLDWIVNTQMEKNNDGVVMLGDGINGLTLSVSHSISLSLSHSLSL
jgi:cation transport ATPase